MLDKEGAGSGQGDIDEYQGKQLLKEWVLMAIASKPRVIEEEGEAKEGRGLKPRIPGEGECPYESQYD